MKSFTEFFTVEESAGYRELADGGGEQERLLATGRPGSTLVLGNEVVVPPKRVRALLGTFCGVLQLKGENNEMFVAPKAKVAEICGCSSAAAGKSCRQLFGDYISNR